MNIKSIIDIFKRAPLYKTPLGRWNIHNYRETTLKIKYATEDNCGVSGQEKNKLYVNDNYHDNYNNYDDKKYIYMMGYESVHY